MTHVKNAKIGRMNTFLRHSRKEYFRYKKTGKLIHLEQAGEKVYNAYILLLEVIHGVNITSHKAVRDYTRLSNNRTVVELGTAADALHIRFYEGGDEFFMERNLFKAWSLFAKLKRRIK